MYEDCQKDQKTDVKKQTKKHKQTTANMMDTKYQNLVFLS